jgi:hypothetical protein
MHAPPGRDRFVVPLFQRRGRSSLFLTPSRSAANPRYENTTRFAFGLDEVGHNGSTTLMQGGNPGRVPFDDRAALEELERLRRAIDEWRTLRKKTQAAFDEFVSGFRTPAREREIAEPSSSVTGPRAAEGASRFASALDAPVADSPAPVISAPLARTANSREPLEPSGLPAPVQVESPLSPIVHVPVGSSVPPAEQRKRQARLVVVAGGVAAITAAGFLLTRSWHATPAESSGMRLHPAPPSAVQIPHSAVLPGSQTSGPVASGAPRTEITALRRVWVRVVVDGTREVERELHADDRVPLRAGRTIVIRTGDAGALRLTMNGQDRGTLGRDGEVVTRTLRTPALPDR